MKYRNRPQSITLQLTKCFMSAAVKIAVEAHIHKHNSLDLTLKKKKAVIKVFQAKILDISF